MIELITIGRIVVDYFWEYKLLSVVHTAFSALLVLFAVVGARGRSFRLCNSDLIALFFLFSFTISFAMSASSDSAIEYVKMLSFVLFYFLGRLLPLRIAHTKYIGLFSLASLTVLTLLEFMGKGYADWGSVSTYTGGYFFKTDLAIAALIFLTFVFVTVRNKMLLAVSFMCAGYLVFKSNARIALPLVLVLPVLISMMLHGKAKDINLKSVVVAIGAAIGGMALFMLIDFQGIGMLGFDFSDPFSDANTQGRSVIWAALLTAYSEASIMEKLVGLGLDADTQATMFFSASAQLEGTRAHNSYLYMLVCMGIAGSASFYWLLFSLYSKMPFLLKRNESDLRAKMIPTLSTVFLVIFCWLSMTTEIIIRPQLMILLFFFAGLHVQSYLKLKTDKRRYTRARASWS